jgi:Holliday junction resolvase-like predicted endonuclease
MNHGLLAESWTAFWLRSQGHHILYHRYKTPYGEIDCISHHDDKFVFTEVKFRKTIIVDENFIKPLQQTRTQNAALYFLRNQHNQQSRFDVILWTKAGNFHYFKDVFHQGDDTQ